MTRIPLRPLAAILQARKRGQDPNLIEQRNTSQRHEAIQNELRSVGEGRLVVLGLMFFLRLHGDRGANGADGGHRAYRDQGREPCAGYFGAARRYCGPPGPCAGHQY